MSKVTGQVWKLFEKSFRNKTLWSFRLENDPTFYRMNEARNAGIVEPGNYIEFDAEPNTDGQSAAVKGTPRKIEPAAAAPVAAGPVSAPAGSRDAHIQYQSARKDALALVALAVQAEAIALPAKVGARLEVLDALVDSYTALYFEDIQTGGAVTRTTERAYAEEQQPEPNPKKAKKAVVETDDGDDEEDE